MSCKWGILTSEDLPNPCISGCLLTNSLQYQRVCWTWSLSLHARARLLSPCQGSPCPLFSTWETLLSQADCGGDWNSCKRPNSSSHFSTSSMGGNCSMKIEEKVRGKKEGEVYFWTMSWSKLYQLRWFSWVQKNSNIWGDRTSYSLGCGRHFSDFQQV